MQSMFHEVFYNLPMISLKGVELSLMAYKEKYYTCFRSLHVASVRNMRKPRDTLRLSSLSVKSRFSKAT